MSACQVDFYLLKTPELDGRRLACRLALMAWERGLHAQVLTGDAAGAQELDELLWSYPPGRFVPHGISGTAEAAAAPVRITTADRLEPGEVVINLCRQPVPQPERFARLLEIVPFQPEERDASREKFRVYRDQGIQPQTHDIAR